jgi:heme-degrading monooxygenase HmoA
MDHSAVSVDTSAAPFVAINYITCLPSFIERFEDMILHRAGSVDKVDGFMGMEVLKSQTQPNAYLVVSRWKTADDFKSWTRSNDFLDGHRAAFSNMEVAMEGGAPRPMESVFQTYKVLCH